ncbi:hypothetical protein [Arthrobacter yangruifuii]|uniref:Integral membrane protein n=1 Tax=Arthrobacter yangruifuii TaxID=2606616 RepID=A0A5N6MGL5_9MICC|nr:hypothetical protein [Arthrobacter yangruifuii]KAD3515383.1 hypothetical protein GD627_14095 [Arthrobacter yangruifuii]
MSVDPLFLVGALVCLVSVVLCIGAAALKQGPNDLTILSAAAVELFLLVYGGASLLRLAGGQGIAGAAWEFWGYLLTALIIPVGAVWWSLMDRSRWSNIVLSAVGITVFVMLFRMEQIWDGANLL